MRNMAYEYYVKNGTYAGLSDADAGVGTDASDIPSACTSTSYYYYHAYSNGDNGAFTARRCTSGGKPPQNVDYGLFWSAAPGGEWSQAGYYLNGGSWIYTSNWSGCCH